VFRRTDLDGFEIEAISRNVARVSYATSLMKKGVLISTTEHVLSAFIGMGIDNAIVELDNLELPILDGSALPIIEMILGAGLRRQRRKRTYLRILREMEVREGEKFIGVYPAEGYSVSYAINFPPPIGQESFTVELSGDCYMREVAPARTFGFNRKFPIAELRQEPAPFRVRSGLGIATDLRGMRELGMVLPDRNTKDTVLFPERIGGRYLDKFAYRDGRWAIAARRVVFDWSRVDPAAPASVRAPRRRRARRGGAPPAPRRRGRDCGP